MGHKISPFSFRLGFNKGWMSRWFGAKNFKNYLKDDVKIRDFLSKKLKGLGVDHVELERSPDKLNVIIFSARPGLIIGRSGAGIEELKKEILLILEKKIDVRIEIQEFKNSETSASITAEQIVEQIEKRLPFRRVMKQTLEKIISGRDVVGAKIQISGPLDGADIARTEHLEKGSLPLQTLRANIDFAQKTAFTTFGTIGVKVWINKKSP